MICVNGRISSELRVKIANVGGFIIIHACKHFHVRVSYKDFDFTQFGSHENLILTKIQSKSLLLSSYITMLTTF